MGPRTSRIPITWEPVSNACFQAPRQTRQHQKLGVGLSTQGFAAPSLPPPGMQNLQFESHCPDTKKPLVSGSGFHVGDFVGISKHPLLYQPYPDPCRNSSCFVHTFVRSSIQRIREALCQVLLKEGDQHTEAVRMPYKEPAGVRALDRVCTWGSGPSLAPWRPRHWVGGGGGAQP